ncbi:family 47 glycoside hydrolase [Cryphonectria parasitica EP155]|uniref:alpha-1,2-Mannosidase n=1 Tax=Cryphonectria parasitica (strain ATCC 38755 / EP155) TaxID=660469 RepID=A0A9P5CLI2_CRYP1|nr:family 47 glycoside hydrolase [Cryphonectria parasitica EP155]KAF3763098.1 family 47 glycoside hydrolase [Cryphonectria parasitica EP155]
MNAHAKNKVWNVKSTFDWSKVKFAYPPGPDIPLPTKNNGGKTSAGGRSSLPRVQAVPFPPETAAAASIREARRAEVRRLFQKNWASYRQHAWMRDALLPVSGAGRDQFSGWAATLVDSLDTLWIMGLRDEFDEAVDAVAKDIDFGSSSQPRVNMFETNIRYLGGLLGAYELSRRSVLLQKAVELGDMLYAGFNTENGMPVDFFNIDKSKSGEGLPIERRVAIAGPGTLLMEFTRLSQITGDLKYYSAISRLVSVFEAGQMKTAVPGLWPTTVSMQTMNVVDGTSFTLGSGADSLYEYITKMYSLLGGKEERYHKMSLAWMDAADENMFYRPMLPDNDESRDSILFSGNLAVVDTASSHELRLDPESEHLSCFLGATYALGGRLFGRDDYLDTGARLTRGCAWAYRVTATGMMCERFNLVKCDSKEKGKPCPWDEAAFEVDKKRRGNWKESLPAGFTTCKDPRYILRPEAIESVFYLWRITGLSEYQEIAWEMFAAVGNGTETEFANAAVMDVTSSERPLKKEDYMESFWLAETLKYFYLALSPPDLISLDEYVLNTEAHPFRLPQ